MRYRTSATSVSRNVSSLRTPSCMPGAHAGQKRRARTLRFEDPERGLAPTVAASSASARTISARPAPVDHASGLDVDRVQLADSRAGRGSGPSTAKPTTSPSASATMIVHPGGGIVDAVRPARLVDRHRIELGSGGEHVAGRRRARSRRGSPRSGVRPPGVAVPHLHARTVRSAPSNDVRARARRRRRPDGRRDRAGGRRFRPAGVAPRSVPGRDGAGTRDDERSLERLAAKGGPDPDEVLARVRPSTSSCRPT